MPSGAKAGVTFDAQRNSASSHAASEACLWLICAPARLGKATSMIVASTYRYFGHHAGDPLNYRAKEEVDPWRAKDPIERLEKALIGRGIMTEEQARQVEEEEQQGVERALEFAQQSPDPALDTLMEDIYA